MALLNDVCRMNIVGGKAVLGYFRFPALFLVVLFLLSYSLMRRKNRSPNCTLPPRSLGTAVFLKIW